jgi:hypothetical protein
LEGRILLLTLSSPLFLLAYSVFAEDEDISKKLDLYFSKLQDMPWWITGLWISVVAAVYGIKATDIINTKKEENNMANDYDDSDFEENKKIAEENKKNYKRNNEKGKMAPEPKSQKIQNKINQK